MTIVATADTRNSQWADDANSYGRRMLAKMGWKGDGAGLGKDQRGTATHLRAVRRSEGLGIGAETDAQGDRGWRDTNDGFRGVLASLNREHGSSAGGSGSDGDYAGTTGGKSRRKEERRRQKKEEKRRGAKNIGDGVRLPQNKVQAGHARKMREAKDIRNKSAEDMAAVFGFKADVYEQSREWPVVAAAAADIADASLEKADMKKTKKKKSKRRSKESGTNADSVDDITGNDSSKKSKKKRKRDT